MTCRFNPRELQEVTSFDKTEIGMSTFDELKTEKKRKKNKNKSLPKQKIKESKFGKARSKSKMSTVHLAHDIYIEDGLAYIKRPTS